MAGNNLLLAKILRDSNTTKGGENALAEQFPQLYGALRGLLGTAPDEVGGSVLDGSHQAQSSGANVGFPLGLLAQMLPAAKLTKGLPVGMSIKPLDYGLPVNPDGTVSLFHGTTKEAAKNILASKMLRSAGEPDVYLTTAKDAGYGDGTVVRVNADPKKLFVDDEFPNGRVDFRMPARNGTASFPDVGLLKQPFVYPQEQALLTAQRNAALPVEQGGLGLHPNNTPMERAQAMGRDQQVFRGTNADEASHSGNVWVTNEPNAANYYTGFVNQDDVYPMLKRHEGGNVMPMLGDNSFIHPDNAEPLWNGGDRFHVPAQTLRSRFAAFDPMRRDSPDILAGLLPLSSMADQDTRNKLAGLLQP